MEIASDPPEKLIPANHPTVGPQPLDLDPRPQGSAMVPPRIRGETDAPLYKRGFDESDIPVSAPHALGESALPSAVEGSGAASDESTLPTASSPSPSNAEVISTASAVEGSGSVVRIECDSDSLGRGRGRVTSLTVMSGAANPQRQAAIEAIQAADASMTELIGRDQAELEALTQAAAQVPGYSLERQYLEEDMHNIDSRLTAWQERQQAYRVTEAALQGQISEDFVHPDIERRTDGGVMVKGATAGLIREGLEQGFERVAAGQGGDIGQCLARAYEMKDVAISYTSNNVVEEGGIHSEEIAGRSARLLYSAAPQGESVEDRSLPDMLRDSVPAASYSGLAAESGDVSDGELPEIPPAQAPEPYNHSPAGSIAGGGGAKPPENSSPYGMSSPDEPSENPFEIMRFEADVAGLYGGQGTVSHEGDEGRISYQDAVALQGDISRELASYVQSVDRESWIRQGGTYTVHEVVPPEDIVHRYEAGLQAGAAGLAEGTLTGRMVSGLLHVSRTLAHGWSDGDRHIDVADGPLKHKAQALYSLTHAVAMLEGNIAPNDGGYRFDQTVSLWRKVEVITEDLQKAYDVVGSYPDIFGNPEATRRMLDDIADRVEQSHPTFMGRIVGQPFPRFGT